MKKTENITIKTTETIKKAIEKIAIENDWTISQVCHRILKEYIEREESRESNG